MYCTIVHFEITNKNYVVCRLDMTYDKDNEGSELKKASSSRSFIVALKSLEKMLLKKCFCFCCWLWWSRCCSCKAPGILQTSYYLYLYYLNFPGCCTDCGGRKLWFWPITYYPGNWPDYIEFILIYLHNNDFSRVLHTLVLIQSPSSSKGKTCQHKLIPFEIFLILVLFS